MQITNTIVRKNLFQPLRIIPSTLLWILHILLYYYYYYIFSYKYIKIRRLYENYRRRTLVIVSIFHRRDRVFRFRKFKTIAYDNIRY